VTVQFRRRDAGEFGQSFAQHPPEHRRLLQLGDQGFRIAQQPRAALFAGKVVLLRQFVHQEGRHRHRTGQQTLESLRVEPILAPPGQARVQSAELEANDPQSRAVNSRLAAQQSALLRRASDVALVESRLRESSRRFELQEETFNGKIANLERDVLRTTREQLIKTIRNMAPDQIKATFINMIRDGAGEEMLAVLRKSNPAEQTKIFAEFQTEEEQIILNDILRLMRQTPAGN
jgi:flagellar motility protein MotE (MotC chaperone)